MKKHTGEYTIRTALAVIVCRAARACLKLAGQGADIAIMDEQAQLGLTDPRKAVRPGQQTAAQMYLTGSLTDIVNRVGNRSDHYYKFNMILKDLRTGEIVWTDEKEIRKVAHRPYL